MKKRTSKLYYFTYPNVGSQRGSADLKAGTLGVLGYLLINMTPQYLTGTCFGYGLNISLERGNVREHSGRLILRGDQ